MAPVYLSEGAVRDMADDKVKDTPPADDAGSGFPFSTPFVPDEAESPAEPDEPAPASMSMTKAELLDRLAERAGELTKAEILALIEHLDADEDLAADPAEPGRVFDPAAREATIEGVKYTWTEASEDTVPEEARLIYARSKAAGG